MLEKIAPRKAWLIALACLLIFSATHAVAGTVQSESWYRDRWCAAAGGQREVRLDDGTRVDCLTGDLAIEFDFAQKWAEAIGQSLHYAHRTGKGAGIVFILKRPGDVRYVTRAMEIIAAYSLPIEVFVLNAGEWDGLPGPKAPPPRE